MNTTLLHGTTAMKVEPVNETLAYIAYQLLCLNKSVEIVLEPGDGTRYDLIMTPAKQFPILHIGRYDYRHWYIVNRFTGGHHIGSALINSGYPEGDIGEISNGNNWTGIFLSWWFKELFLLMDGMIARVGGVDEDNKPS